MKRIISFIIPLLTIFVSAVVAQRPTHVPGAGEPTRFFESPVSVILYIIIPLIILVLYVVWRRNINKQQKNQQDNN